MDAQPETTAPTDEKKSINWWAFLLWPFIILLLYVLSTGPVVMLVHQANVPLPGFLWWFYKPIHWAYEKTPLL